MLYYFASKSSECRRRIVTARTYIHSALTECEEIVNKSVQKSEYKELPRQMTNRLQLMVYEELMGNG